jgi:hypothetical protein
MLCGASVDTDVAVVISKSAADDFFETLKLARGKTSTGKNSI